ncbi:lipid IV(A) 3-deoxy-D-manno-octulosonic acid transferase [Shewanella sp. SW36]|uniref:lipid IV(A) 3-deoxy-D-manno-octulosonic acid transferase n=1 Tax=Shewanella TaxID=22 RepID=UPI0021D83C50|nr:MULTISPECIES: lipid IV(A) 3-deoxy-D-manno-octulosonic acid transferase [unclassified Shewanella]MCU7976617.1 lipid IV(A) 3-deoxy-D-manno-octulosonic acid transferase [Shewanella sp. SW36]MCU7991857.1 lipid IV(A) 3-deoxy-D-manno-octulosonic acid transferase [Shewanella sp. SW1]MCU8014265.1 lipid IV(A) 3-deoxy-D-manno-octulosonic acid transferase [Shewanella sp. SM74]MCU8053237.1 lipid IV(A) 3-deoxy-D-manno-octulosonic acid transferase [Shewanella sp. SM43]
MNRFLYSTILYLLFPLLIVYLAFRAIKSPDYCGRWGERFGLTRLKSTDLLIHSVSMGETLAAIPLIRLIMQSHPELSITVTTTSPTGSAQVRKAFGDSVQHCYLPFDLPWCVERFLRQVSPKSCIIMETELWPNLVALAAKRGVRLMLANARLSAKSAAQYAKRPKLSRPMLQRLDVIAVQTQVEAQRFIELGVSPDRVTVCGSLKFDLSITPERLANAKLLRQTWGRKTSPIWVAGSVHPGEFDAMLIAHRQLLAQWPDALLIIAPRHPEQFSAVAEVVASQGFELIRRSGNLPVTATTQVLVGDTMGELLTFYGAADQAFVGGTLINNGGHNPLEPVAMGVPVMVGPNHWDFAQITQMLADAGGLRVVTSSDELAANLIAYFAKPELRQLAANAGLAVVEANRGALQRQFLLAQSLIN